MRATWPVKPKALQAPHEEIKGIPVLGEDDDLLVGVAWVLQYFTQPDELGLLPQTVHLSRQRQKMHHLAAFDFQVSQ